MRSCKLAGSFLSLLAFSSVRFFAQSPSYPASLVDAQIPIVSSDGFSSPQGVAVAPGGIVYVADTGKQRILTFAYQGSQSAVSLGSFGPSLQRPAGLALDGGGNLYVTDTDTNRLIKLRAPVGTLAALTVIGPGILDRPTAVASDAAGNLAIVNSGNAKIVARRAGGSAFLFNTDTTTLVAPTAVAFDNVGNLYVADAGNGTAPSAIYRFPKLGGNGTNLAPAGYDLKNINGLAFDDARNLYALDSVSKQLIEIPASGATAYLVPQSNFSSPNGLGIDNLGNLYVSDAANTVTKLVYNNAADFGSIRAGMTTAPITFNYEFYQPTVVKARRGIGGGVWNAEYKVAGGTCGLRTYRPSTSGTGLTLPATCTAAFTFTPSWVNGRPGATQVATSNGNVTQLTIGVGRGAQLAALNATVSDKLAGQFAQTMATNAANTEIYYSNNTGTYRVPVGGGTPTLISPHIGDMLAVNGAGDVYLLDYDRVEKIPADGSAPVLTIFAGLPGYHQANGIGVDANGAIYISDAGIPSDYGNKGYILRISPSGGVTTAVPYGWVVTPLTIISDTQGDIAFMDPSIRGLFKFAAWKGNFTPVEIGPDVGGLLGGSPSGIALEDSGTLYYWDSFAYQLAYSPPLNLAYPYPSNIAGEFIFPLYTVPGVSNLNGYYPFIPAGGDGSYALSVTGKLYIKDSNRDVWNLVDRTHGLIPKEAFNPNFQYSGGQTQNIFLYNVGNENLTFTDPSNFFAESGNGVGAFTFSPTSGPYATPACVAGGTIPPAGVCMLRVTSANAYGTGPTVTDTLHFLTDAVNNGSVDFKISGAGAH